jgi:hypothetical protein
MTEVANQTDHPLDDVPADEIQYRSMSGLAVIGFLLGLLSLLALVAPVFWVIPLAAIAVATVALGTIRNDSNKGGAWLAKAGLVVALCVGLWAVSYHFGKDWYLFHHAKKFADQWFEVVQSGNLQEAHQLHLVYLNRCDKDKLDEYYANSEIELEDSPAIFFTEEPLDEFIRHADEGKLEYVGRKAHSTFKTAHYLTLTYVLTYGENDANEVVMNVVLERNRDYRTGVHYWRIESVTP